MNVSSFSSIPYYSNVRLISKIELEYEVLEPHPHLNGGQQLGARGLSIPIVK